MEALLELDEGLREVLLLRFFEELSAAEIARLSLEIASTVDVFTNDRIVVEEL